MMEQFSNVFHKHFPRKIKSNHNENISVGFLPVNLLKYYVFESNKLHQWVSMVTIELMH
jgi:hypothetical protein